MTSVLMEQLIPIINRLQEVFEAVDPESTNDAFSALDLPRIVVVGSQSSGKSSVLESLVCRDFLPRGKDIVTRRPLVLQLIHNTPIIKRSMSQEQQQFSDEDDEGFSEAIETELEWAEFGHLPGQRFTDFLWIRREIEADTNRVAGVNKGISRVPIQLRIYSPRVVNLTLVDLPGITKIPVGDQPADIEAQIRSLVWEYVSRPNSIILAVTPANSDLANSDALKIAREADPLGERTLGVLTKLDLMDSGTHALEILQGKGPFRLRLGFIGLVNRSQHDINLNKPVGEALKAEKDYFATHPQYRLLGGRAGAGYLAVQLNKILMNHIRHELPELRERINGLIVATQSELASYSEDFGGVPADHKGSMLLKLVTSYVADFCQAIQGTLRHTRNNNLIHNPPSSKWDEDFEEDSLFGGARIAYIFNEQYAQALGQIEATTGLGLGEIRNAIRNSTGPRPALFVPEASFEILAKRQIAKLAQPARQCVDMVYEEMQRIALGLDQHRSEYRRFPNLAARIVEETSELIRERLAPTLETVEQLIELEMAYINTNHPDFWRSSTALVTLARLVEDKRRGGAGTGSASSSIPVSPISSNTPVIDSVEGEKEVDSHTQTSTGLLAYLFKGATSSDHGPSNNRRPRKTFVNSHQQQSLNSPQSTAGQLQPGFPQYIQPEASGSDDLLLRSISSANSNNANGNLSEKEQVEVHLITSLLQSYHAIVKRTLADMVPKAVMHLLVNHVQAALPARLVSALYGGGATSASISCVDFAGRSTDLIDHLMQEDPAVIAQRNRCIEALKAYKKAASLLSELRQEQVKSIKTTNRTTD